jgi:hypothetical protein
MDSQKSDSPAPGTPTRMPRLAIVDRKMRKNVLDTPVTSTPPTGAYTPDQKNTSRVMDNVSTLLKHLPSFEGYVSNSDEDEEEVKAKNALKPNRTYNMSCGGRNVAEGSALRGKKVEWKASFGRPLEELIYPSLQHFNTKEKVSYSFSSKRKKDFEVEYKPQSVESGFAEATPDWVVSISDEGSYDQEASSTRIQGSAEEGLYSQRDIEARGEAHLKNRLKESASFDLLENASGWPSANKPELTRMEQITVDTVSEVYI